MNMPLISILDIADASPLHLKVRRGATFDFELTYGAGSVDFTSRRFRMDARVVKNQASVLALTEVTSLTTTGRVSGLTNQRVKVIIPASVVTNWPERLCEYIIEMEESSNYWVPVVAGKLIVSPRIGAA